MVSIGNGPCSVRMTSRSPGNRLCELVGVLQRATEKACDEGDLRPDLRRRRGLPLDRLDVGVPIGAFAGSAANAATRRQRTVDDDLRVHVDAHDGLRVLVVTMDASTETRRRRGARESERRVRSTLVVAEVLVVRPDAVAGHVESIGHRLAPSGVTVGSPQ